MKNKLQQLFPMIKSRQAVLAEIHSRPDLLSQYNSWNGKHQREFLDFTTGARGCKLLYDSFFKEILNPETVPSRLNTLLSLILGKEVQILSVLPTDNSRLGAEESLVIMDIVVRLDDGSIIDVEIQKIGYRFPGQRSACYSSDLLLRQYKAVKDQTASGIFSYKNIHRVYTIVFFEQSPKEFHQFPDTYLHRFSQKSDSGLEVEHLQYYFYVPLDIFLKSLHNKGIRSDLDAWLAFLGSDDPEDILSVIQHNPAFREMYEHIYDICQNVEEVMNMFSKELQILDRNTVRLMIDEMKDELTAQKNTISEQQGTISEQQTQLSQKDDTISEQQTQLSQKDDTISEQLGTISEQQDIINKLRAELAAAKFCDIPTEK